MSSIASVRDGIQDLRKKSLLQERAIDRNGEYSHWRLSDATSVSILERGLGLLILPICFFWALLLLLFSIGIGVCLLAFKALSWIFR